MANLHTMYRAARARCRRTPLLGFVLLLAGLALASSAAVPVWAGDLPRHRLAVLPVEIADNSGESGAADRHKAMLTGLTRVVNEQLAASGLFEVVPQERVAEAVAAENPGTYLRACNGCERDIAKRVGADRVMMVWIFKMSSLVLTLHVVIKDVATGDVVFAHAFDFRGDNEKAWQRAGKYMVATLARAHGTN